MTVGAGGEYQAGAVGGEKEHTLTVAELPKNIGNLNALSWAKQNYMTTGAFTVKQNNKDRTASAGTDFGDAIYTLSGGGAAHNNMPPFIATYRYRRIK